MCTSCCPFVQFACQCCNLTWPHTVTYSWPQLPPTDNLFLWSLFLCSNLLKWLMHIFLSWIKLLLFFCTGPLRNGHVTSPLLKDAVICRVMSWHVHSLAPTCAAAGELHRPQSAPGEGRTYTPSAAANQLTRWLWAEWLGESMTSCLRVALPVQVQHSVFKMNTHCLKCLQHS